MSNLKERLRDLIVDTQKDAKTIANEIGIPASCFSYYLSEERVPNITTLIKIADYFNCSTDYLLGIKEEESNNLVFKKCPPFSERLVFLQNYFKCKPSEVYENAGVSKSGYFEWKRGKHLPSIDNVIKIANHFDRSVDFILGRES